MVFLVVILLDVEEKQIVAIAKQKGFETTADLTALYTKLEEMTGISEIGLREAYEFDAYALVFQKGAGFFFPTE